MTEVSRDRSGVRIHPPILWVLHLAAAVLLGWLVSLPLPAPVGVTVAGWAVTLLGLGFGAGGLRQLLLSHTSPNPDAPTTRVVTTGIYRFTRNPIYVGFLCLLIGLPLIFGDYWGVILALLQVILFNRLIIRHEEAYLSAKFGAEYTDYKRKVRRWV